MLNKLVVKIKALNEFVTNPNYDFPSLLSSFKRIKNILPDNNGKLSDMNIEWYSIINQNMQQLTPELTKMGWNKYALNLYLCAMICYDVIEDFERNGEYLKSINYLTSLISPINELFDNVLMDSLSENEKDVMLFVRYTVMECFEKIGDWSMLKK